MDDHREDHVAASRARATAIASDVVAGLMSPIVGARLLVALRFSVGVREDDRDFTAFVAIDSEADGLPIGAVRRLWDPTVLIEMDTEIARAEAWAADFGREAFRSVVDRFGTPK
jgi:hypothetical protein